MRRERDPQGQHRTQLASLENTLCAATARLADVAGADRGRTTLDAYDFYREIDRQTTLIRRIWRWFADKYDQRDHPSRAGVLRAADEVVWAVHAEVHRAAGADPPPPAPLPYLEEVDAPEAVPRDEPSTELRPDGFDDVLRSVLARLPVPVVGLPPLGPAGPGALVLLGHEVGHHLLYDLRPGRRVLAELGEAVRVAAGDREPARWRAWSQEVFADLVGLVALGTPLITSLLRYEMGTEDHLFDRGRGRYPAPAVRLALLAEMSRRLGLPAHPTLEESDPSGWAAPRDDGREARRTAVRDDMAQVPAIVSALLDFRPDGDGTLPELLDFDVQAHERDGRIATKARHLLSGSLFADSGLAEVRELASAGALAWQRLLDRPDVGQGELDAFTETLCGRLVAAREPGTRAAGNVAQTDADAGLMDLLTAPVAR
ncbi:hypothetical protein [Blastococcus sp. DSM 46786]|uniref:hypothetical protein n=1 Tax=Blastococcus sp. DSM 46786 TaxID=1798227 RepID=UPI000B850AE2|nr:hypothetical protein [Blastococcus sp. DSM 46786]